MLYSHAFILMHFRIMAAKTKSTIYEGIAARVFQSYLQNSDEHTAVVHFLEEHLPGEFKRYQNVFYTWFNE